MIRPLRVFTALLPLTAAAVGAQSVPTLIASPRLTIGDSVAGSPTMFNRLSDARRLSDGRIVVAVCGDRQLRSYDATGKHLATVELSPVQPQRSLTRLFPAGGDTLAAFESLNSKLTLIAADLSTVRVVPIANPLPPRPDGLKAPSPLDVIGRFADGTFLGRVVALPSGAGIVRRTMALYRFDNAGALLDSLVDLPASEAFVAPGTTGWGAVRLGRSTSIAVFPDRVVVGDQTRAEVAEYGRDLRPLRRTPTVTTPQPMTDSIKSLWTAIATARTNFPVNGILPVYRDAYADMTPAFADLVAGVDGHLWVQDPAGPDSYPLVWTAYRDARPVARAELPPRFYPTQFGNNWVLGLAFDTTTVERVQLLSLAPGTLTGRRLVPREAAPANRPRCGAWTSR